MESEIQLSYYCGSELGLKHSPAATTSIKTQTMSTFQPLCKVWKVRFLAVLMNAESYRSVHGTDHWRALLASKF